MAVVSVAANVTDDGHQCVLPCGHNNKVREKTVMRCNQTSDILMDIQLDGCTAADQFKNEWNKRKTVRKREKETDREAQLTSTIVNMRA